MTAPLFTAGRIALALGRSRRGVLTALRSCAPWGTVTVNGQAANGWALVQLPEAWQQQLAADAPRRGFRDAEHLLSAAPPRWEPEVPVGEVAQHHLDKAVRLHRVLARALALRDAEAWEEPEVVESFLREYREEFGQVSRKHWLRIYERTIARDAGAERFDELALYLDERLTRKAGSGGGGKANNEGDQVILDYLSRVANPASPSLEVRALVWTVVCEQLAARMDAGEKPHRARAAVCDLLLSSGVALSKTPEALKRLVKEKFAEWAAGGRTINALQDARPHKSGWHRSPELGEDRLQLIAHATLNCGGRLSQAWRELSEEGRLSDGLSAHHVANPASKSYVPGRVRAEIAPEVNRLEAIHHGPREHKLRGAFHNRDWSDVAAGDWYQADDVTPPLYYWKETERGVEVMRGQFLPIVDERTTYVLGFVLISLPNYNSRAIRSLITTACGEHGLPRVGFSFERGIWKSAKILTGDRNAVPWEVTDQGLRSLGLTFRHALLPRGKVIERMIGQLQDLMEGLPGYAGRDERNDKFERMQRQKLDVEAGRVPADKHFLSEQEAAAAFQRLLARYNAAPQQGRKLNGLSPEEGWVQLQSTPRARFDEKCIHLLAHDRRKVKVGRNGITITIGKDRFNFKDGETGQREGETVMAWFNPMRPDLLPCTDLDGKNVFSVQRSYGLPAVGATPEQLAAENAKVAAHNGYATELYRAVKNILPTTSFRQNLVDASTAQVGQEIAAQREEITIEQREERAVRAQVGRKAAELGIAAGVLSARTPQVSEALDRMAQARRNILQKTSREPSSA